MSSPEIQVNLFKIALKKKFTGDIKYGIEKYNTDSGLMLFSEPGQVVSWQTLSFWDGYAFVFHPDLFKAHPVAVKIRQYKYFSYEVSDALFMTTEESETITWLFTRIHLELTEKRNNTNVDLILSLLNTVLSYAEIFYKRQFLVSAKAGASTANRVRTILQRHYDNLERPAKHLPRVSAIAEELSLSPNHLTTLIRKETKKSTVELIHEFVTDQAEILLLQTDMNISDVAYQLGFESVSYFSRLFRKMKGASPIEVRNRGKV